MSYSHRTQDIVRWWSQSLSAPIATNRIKHCPTIGPFQSLLRRSTNAFAVFFNSGWLFNQEKKKKSDTELTASVQEKKKKKRSETHKRLKEDFLKNLYVLSRFVLLKSVLLIRTTWSVSIKLHLRQGCVLCEPVRSNRGSWRLSELPSVGWIKYWLNRIEMESAGKGTGRSDSPVSHLSPLQLL